MFSESDKKTGDFMNFEKRYPVERTVYMQTTGRLLPRRISQILRMLGFSVWTNPSQGNDIDMKVWHNDRLILAVEILNWSIGSNMSDKRLRKMISNLNKYNCRKLLIYTTLDEKSLSTFAQNGIDVLQIGYQLLPKSYYNFFSLKEQVKKRKIDSASTKEEITHRIISYLKKHSLHIGIYLQLQNS